MDGSDGEDAGLSPIADVAGHLHTDSMRRSWFAMVGGLAVMQAGTSLACRAGPDPVDYRAFKTIAVARVTKVEMSPVPNESWAAPYAQFNWSAEYEVQKFVRGTSKVRKFDNQHSAGPGSCWFNKAPKIGDLRVLYMRVGENDEIAHDLDLQSARRDDPSLRKLLPK